MALDDDLAGVAPVYQGEIQSVGQVGSLVRIPQGLVDLVASVSLVGIAELSGPLKPTAATPHDERWLQVELLGEIDRGTREFRRGVGTYPGIDDTVHFATQHDLRLVFPKADEHHIPLGRLAAAERVPICLHAARLVVRHAAVVGSTGSGKTSAVASLLQNLVRGGWGSANVVVIDPHGEYPSALRDCSKVRSVLAQGASGLRVPYWALPAAEISRIFCGIVGGTTFQARFSELVADARREFATNADWLQIEPASVTANTPVPFDIRDVWYTLAYENRTTLEKNGDLSSACEENAGNADTLVPPTFKHYGLGSKAPFKGPYYDSYGEMPSLLRRGLLDPQLQFLQQPKASTKDGDPLVETVQEWLGEANPMSVLDFSGVPPAASDAAIGVVLNLLFELCLRTGAAKEGVGRPHPILIVLEEAHRYLGAEASNMAREAANRIAREGRKYGIGLLMVSQRPTELPKTALAQCGTIIALRLSSADDQGAIRSALPDSVAGLASALASLRTGEAVISGESLILPSRVLIAAPNPAPRAQDATLEPWRQEDKTPDVAPPLKSWRETYGAEG